HQFGRPIGSFQAIKHKCADMLLRLTGTRVAVYNAAASWSSSEPIAGADASAAKAFAGEATAQIAGEALQVHGGIGMAWEHDLHLFLRRIRADGVLYGDAAHHHERLCAELVSARGA